MQAWILIAVMAMAIVAPPSVRGDATEGLVKWVEENGGQVRGPSRPPRANGPGAGPYLPGPYQSDRLRCPLLAPLLPHTQVGVKIAYSAEGVRGTYAPRAIEEGEFLAVIPLELAFNLPESGSAGVSTGVQAVRGGPGSWSWQHLLPRSHPPPAPQPDP
jgi:hypothetical protein